MIKGLEAFEILKQDIGACYEEETLIVEKNLKAFEIIKCLLFGKCKVYKTSEKTTATTITKSNYYVIELKLTNERFYVGKEEYDLLKEIMKG